MRVARPDPKQTISWLPGNSRRAVQESRPTAVFIDPNQHVVPSKAHPRTYQLRSVPPPSGCAPMPFPIRNPENYERLRKLGPNEAIACFLVGDFAFGEDAALLEVIQRGL